MTKKAEEYVKGYRMGFFTAFDFVIKYCEDMKKSYDEVDKLCRKKQKIE